MSVFKVRDISTFGGGNDQSGPAAFGAAANCHQFSGVIVSSELDGAESGQRFQGEIPECGTFPVTGEDSAVAATMNVNIGGQIIGSRDRVTVERRTLNAFDRIKLSGQTDHPWVEQLIFNFFLPAGEGFQSLFCPGPMRHAGLPPAGLYILGAGGDTLATGRIQNFRAEPGVIAS